jgi:hypothetical protein
MTGFAGLRRSVPLLAEDVFRIAALFIEVS